MVPVLGGAGGGGSGVRSGNSRVVTVSFFFTDLSVFSISETNSGYLRLLNLVGTYIRTNFSKKIVGS